MNDDWPNPAADFLPGPILKIRRKIVGISCANGPYNYTTTCYDTIAYIDQFGSWSDMPMGFVAPFEYSKTYLPYSQTDTKRLVLMIRDNKLRVMYEDTEFDTVVGAFVFDLSPWNYVGGGLGFYMSAHQAEFSNFLVGALSGPDAVTQFCNGGLCDDRTGLCLTQPTFNPTSRFGDVAAANICPGPVGGNQVSFDTTDLSLFTFIDQEWLSEPCVLPFFFEFCFVQNKIFVIFRIVVF